MSQKSKSIKKIEEEQSSIEEEISIIHDKKQMFGKTYYLIQYKGNDSKKEWKPQAQLKNNPTFMKKFMSFQIKLKHKNTPVNSNIAQTQSPQPKQSKDISLEKQTKNPQTSSIQPKKIHIQNEKIKISSIAIKQQLSLDKFVNKSNTNKMVDENEKKDSTITVEQSKKIKQSMSKMKTETNTISTKPKQQQLKQQMKTLNINQAPKQQVKVNSVWLDKIKSISRVKGYELKNGQMLYDVQVSDKNGQNFFIPPLPSEVVLKFDAVKLAGFLQDCMLRGYAEQAKTK